MKYWAACLMLGLMGISPATMISVVPIYQPLSLHGTDVDGDISDVGEPLSALVMSRPMALSGAFPESLVTAIREPHRIPTDSDNYKVVEANLLVLCKVGIDAVLEKEGLKVTLNVSALEIPVEVDLTSRQVLKLALIALRKTLEGWQGQQTKPLEVTVVIAGADEAKATLADLGGKLVIGEEGD